MTLTGSAAYLFDAYFNSHTREGVTRQETVCSYKSIHFNSHTREGVTLRRGEMLGLMWNFNSHTREGVTYL